MAATGADRLTQATRVGDAAEAAEPVGDDPCTALHDPPGDFLGILLCESPHALQLTSSVVSTAPTNSIFPGLPHPRLPLQRLVPNALQHHLPQLVGHLPGRIDVETLRQLQRRHGLLGLGHMEHDPEPHGQSKLGEGEDLAGRCCTATTPASPLTVGSVSPRRCS